MIQSSNGSPPYAVHSISRTAGKKRPRRASADDECLLAICTGVVTSQTVGEQHVLLETSWEILDDRLLGNSARCILRLEIDHRGDLVISPTQNVELDRLLRACGLAGKEWSLGALDGTTAYVRIDRRRK